LNGVAAPTATHHPIVGSVYRLAWRIVEALDLNGHEFSELAAYELIRAQARLRGKNRVEAKAEWMLDLTFGEVVELQQEMAKFGRPIPHLFTVGTPDQIERDRLTHEALTRGQPYRLNGRLYVKDADDWPPTHDLAVGPGGRLYRGFVPDDAPPADPARQPPAAPRRKRPLQPQLLQVIQSQVEYDALAPGALYVGSDGRRRQKPT